jgi:rubredoxin
MVKSAGSWTDGGTTSEILEDVSGRTYVVTYGSQDERAGRIKMIEEFAGTYSEEQVCVLCGHKFEEYTGRKKGWHHMETSLTCGHPICLVCQLKQIASALEHSSHDTCLPYDALDENTGEFIPACAMGRLCTRGKLNCPKCGKTDSRRITDIPCELGFEYIEVDGRKIHELVKRRLESSTRKRFQRPLSMDKPWMRYRKCQRSKICREFGDCSVTHPTKNPKKQGTAAARRWEKYKDYRYVWQMIRDGFGEDVSYHLRNQSKGHMCIEQ